MGYYDKQYQVRDFTVLSFGVQVSCRLFSPLEQHLAAEPLLYLSCANTIERSLQTYPYCNAVDFFLSQGHRVAAFDPPCHGSRAGSHGSDIPGLCASFLAGEDPFEAFVHDGKKVIDACIDEGITEPGKIVVGGVSRSGYFALRLLAEEPRIAALAAFCPVTDWRVIGLSHVKERKEVADLWLGHYVDRLVGKPIMLIIPNHDTVVKTERCLQFYIDLQDANSRAGYDDRWVDLLCTDDPFHTCSGVYYTKAADFLIKRAMNNRSEKR